MPQILQLGSRGLSSQNWKVYHPDGTHMFTCGERRAYWYLENQNEEGEPLAIQIGEFEIQLTFHPKGKGYKTNEVFGLAGRKIQCVVTGEEEGLQRHHIVPYCYRTHFNEEYKSKNHHDVVLVTHKVHEAYELEATKFKNQLAKEFNIKSLNELNLEYTKILSEYSEDKIKAMSKLNAIFASYGRIPRNVIIDNLKFVSDVSGVSYNNILSKYNYVQLFKFYTILRQQYQSEIYEFKLKNGINYDHGKLLVEKLDNHEKIEQFVKRWRIHFLKTMKPKYMPDGWSVDFRVKVEI